MKANYDEERQRERTAREKTAASIDLIRREGFPAAIELTDAVAGGLTEEQRGVLSQLDGLAESESTILRQINARRPTPSGVLSLPGGVITLCEDEDDFRVITAGLRNELTTVRSEIKSKLAEAIGSGLAHLGIIQRQCAAYQVI